MSVRWIYILVLSTVMSGVWAQGEPWLPADQAVHILFKEHRPNTAADFFAIADSLAAKNGDCEVEVIEQVMRMNGWTFNMPPADWEALVTPRAGCDVPCARHRFLAGALHYQAQNWEQAILAFRQAFELSQDSTFRSEALNNLSATYSQRGGTPDSVFIALERALRYANAKQSPYILNNLAALQIQQKQWERAKQFIDRIPMNAPNLPPNLLFNAQLNHLAIAIRTGKLDLAHGLIDALDTLEVTPGNHCTHARLVSKYYLLSADYEAFAMRYPALQAVVAACDSDQHIWQTEGLLYQPWRKRMAARDSSLEPVSREVWAALCWAEKQLLATEMDHLESVRLAADKEVDAAPPAPSLTWLWAFAGALGVGAGCWLLRKKGTDMEPRAVTRKHLRNGLNELRELNPPPALKDAIDRLELEWFDQEATVALQQSNPELDLSPVEQEVLHMLASGRNSKDIARTMDLSVSYVYNIRGRLRKKLDVPDGVDFDDWIAKRFGVS